MGSWNRTRSTLFNKISRSEGAKAIQFVSKKNDRAKVNAGAMSRSLESLPKNNRNLKHPRTKETTTTNCIMKGLGRERLSRRENSTVNWLWMTFPL